MNFFRPISISLSPNTEKDDVFLALKLLFQPWRWQKEQPSESRPPTVELEEEFKRYLGVKYAISFNSGRSALMAILDALEIKNGDEVLLQAFTCNSAVNPILERGAKPVYVDIDDTLNLDPVDLKRKITHSINSGRAPKAIMIQHNFGWPAKIEEILKIARENNLYLIEDCAHSLGAKYEGRPCGTFGDVAFFSFGRDKIISSVFGGLAVTNNEKIGEGLKRFQAGLFFPSSFWICQQLWHPILMNYLILPAYGVNSTLGRVIIGVFHKLLILSKAVYKKEKKGKIPQHFPKFLPNALAILGLNQFKKLERFNEHRREIAKFYERELINFYLPLATRALAKGEDERSSSPKPWGARQPIFMRYPVLTNLNTSDVLKAARKRKIYLDDGWRKSPVVPPDTDIEKMQYLLGSCPRAEKVAKSILNLPTHINISQDDAKRVVNFLKTYGD